MKPIHDAYLASTNSRSGPSNALSNSVLIDDEEGASSTTRTEDSGPPPKPPPEQRIMLLQALLAIGDLPSAMIILARFPWLAQSHPAIADLIMRNVAYALEPLYEAIRQRLVDEEGEIDKEVALPGYPVTNRQQLTPTYLFPLPPDTSGSRYEFFYPDWKDELDEWASLDDLLSKGLRWLGLIRGTAGRQVDTMVKICRIGAAHFAALRREKEVARGLITGAKTKEDIQSVEVSFGLWRVWRSSYPSALPRRDEALARSHPTLPPSSPIHIQRHSGFRRRAMAPPSSSTLSRTVLALRRMER